MKIKETYLYFLLVICVIIFFIGLDFNMKKNRIKTMSERIEINIDECQIEKREDTHSGFLGDGETFVKMSCPNLKYEELSGNWKELPLSDSLSQATHLKQCMDGGCKDIYERYLIPTTINGYYYFLDRHSEAKEKHDDSIINERSSYNFTLAIIEKETNIIYYYELDT